MTRSLVLLALLMGVVIAGTLAVILHDYGPGWARSAVRAVQRLKIRRAR